MQRVTQILETTNLKNKAQNYGRGTTSNIGKSEVQGILGVGGNSNNNSAVPYRPDESKKRP